VITIGILGAGQLGKMLAEAATKLGYQTHIYAPDEDHIATKVATHFTHAAYEDLDKLQAFAKSVDVITLEFENVPTAPLKTLGTPIYPGVAVLETSQHRVREKAKAQSLGIGTAPFAAVTSQHELIAAIATIGTQGILKTCTMGYDGKGQWKNPTELPAAGDYIYEGFVNFTKEISVIVARNTKGDIECFEPVENVHKNHILHTTTAPADISDQVRTKAITIATTLADALKVVGLLAVELFVTADNDVLMNEMAPRPHNSGHWTLDGCNVSQFEQAIRAVTGMPLIQPVRTASKVVMTNLIGDDKPDEKAGNYIHIYGKKESRPGRKMGHVTFVEVASC
jgi:5-(carboxyamino)imidazole ribonucleotide synthase